jgi:acyl-CoA synthetase (AMP-forming)/AMP-acid ligase II
VARSVDIDSRPGRRHRVAATTLGDLLHRRAGEHPEREAVVFPTERASYGELAARAGQLARGLVGLGVRPGDRVGILLPASVDLLALLFASTDIGAIAVPVNARFKAVELARLVVHSGMRVLITAPPAPGEPDFAELLAGTFPGLDRAPDGELDLPGAPELRRIVQLGGPGGSGLLPGTEFDALASVVDPAAVDAAAESVRVRDTAVLVYTSGTTASPKGAMLSHEALTRLADGIAHERMRLSPEDRVWTAIPLFHGVAAGIPGELLFRGPNAFDGYFRDPELTATVFDSEGWFHSGDVVVADEDGRLTFLSRLKDMLKVGGENVSAAEVEGFLLGHPAVGLVAVVAAPDARYVEVPAAFVQLAPGRRATERELIDFCVGRIASYRVPRYVRFVTEWPMSGTKVKKVELRARIAGELAAAGISEAPRVTSGGTAGS